MHFLVAIKIMCGQKALPTMRTFVRAFHLNESLCTFNALN
uniref:Uncharacterized protein n=1 Tax=Anguilla anguilla TaxID=7936 RepID=A0A0E9PPY7_ANGAN